MEKEGNENLISINELIIRAQKAGFNFGNGKPRHRLRYYTKLGLIPPAQRKSFNNSLPSGAYPESVVNLLIEIDRKIKEGKSIQAIKREQEKKKEERKEEILVGPPLAPLSYIYKPPYTPPSEPLQPPIPTPPLAAPQVEEGKIPKVIKVRPKPFVKILSIIKIVFLILICGGTFFFLISQAINKDFLSYFLASLDWGKRLAQIAPPLAPGQEVEEIFAFPSPEPYLTINAETDINAPLNVKEIISAPALTLLKGEFKAQLTSADLTADRAYTFPNQSGVICLTTGNCVGIGGEVTSPGGLPNRLAKFITSREIGVSSINDLYVRGVALTIDSFGNVGIGTSAPEAKLEVAGDVFVEGEIQATGDICTDLQGGKCLSQLTAFPTFFWGGGGGGISGSGAANYLSIWTGSTALGNSIIYQSGSNIGIGTTAPTQVLDVAGTIKMLGFQLPTNATSGYILTSDASGFGTWQPSPSGVLPSGESGQTLRHNGTNWVANSFLYNTGTAIGIGATSTQAELTVAGSGLFSGFLTLATTTLPQLVLKYDNNNYLNFSISDTQSLITASKKLVIDSLSGEIKLGDNVTDFYAPNATITALTFISTSTDSTVRKSGEKVFRGAIPIFRFPVPAQTNSTSFVAVSREISTTTLNAALPESLPGTDRKIAFLINFADNIPTNASSTWLIDLETGTDTEFTFTGQNLSSLEEGKPHLSDFYLLPDNDWQLEVKVPASDRTIRIFNILLLAYDQIQ